MSHKPARPIQEQIQGIIDKRLERLKKEIEDFQEKKDDAEYVYGLGGGQAQRYEECIKKRRQEIMELTSMANSYGGPIITTAKSERYRYTCSCGGQIETREPIPREWADCPFCRGGMNKATENHIRREVVIPPKPAYEDDAEAWERRFT